MGFLGQGQAAAPGIQGGPFGGIAETLRKMFVGGHQNQVEQTGPYMNQMQGPAIQEIDPDVEARVRSGPQYRGMEYDPNIGSAPNGIPQLPQGNPLALQQQLPPQGGTAPYDPSQPEQARVAPPREGLFGLKGDARNIVGVLGDIAAMHSGGEPLYTRQRAAEREQDRLATAMSGFADNPLEAARALRASGYHKEANELYQAAVEQQRKGLETQSKVGADRALTRKRTHAVDDIIRGQIGNVMAGASEADYTRLKAMAEMMAERGGITDFQLPETYEEYDEQREQYTRGTMTYEKNRDQILRAGALQVKAALGAGSLAVQGAKADQTRDIADRNERGRTVRAEAAEEGKDRRAANKAAKGYGRPNNDPGGDKPPIMIRGQRAIWNKKNQRYEYE